MSNEPIYYDLQRSRRRTLSLEVTKEAAVVIRAPWQFPQAEIERFVEQKRSWIERKMAIARERAQEAAPKEFKSGENFFFQGKAYTMIVVDQPDPPLSFDNGFYISRRHQHKARKLLLDWFRARAHETLSARTGYYSYYIGVKFRRIRISNARSRWGACSGNGDISFSWRLIMAPPRVIDYVVIHELTHLLEHNHSARFWNRIQDLYPDYKDSKQWLRDNGHLLTI